MKTNSIFKIRIAGLSSAPCGQELESLNSTEMIIISYTILFPDTGALSPVFLSTNLYIVTLQFNWTLANNY